jgi:serine protease Do
MPVKSRRTILALTGTFLWLCGVLSQPQAALAQDATPLEQVRALVQPGVVYEDITWTARIYDRSNKGFLSNFDKKGAPVQTFTVTFRCTGFIVNPTGFVVTAGHCLQYDLEGRTDDPKGALVDAAAQWAYTSRAYYLNENLSLKKIREFAAKSYQPRGINTSTPRPSPVVAYGVAVSGLPSGKPLPARLVGLQKFEVGDVALLKIEGENLPTLELAPQQEIEVGTQVVAVGYPASVDLVTDATFDPSFKSGDISNIRTIQSGLLTVYEINADVSGGMSGGPAVDLQGRVIGVNSFGIRGETGAFNFIRPVSSVAEILADEGVQNEIGDLNQVYRQGVTAYFARDRERAMQLLTQVLDQVPSHELAQEFRAKAAQLPVSPPAAEGFPFGLAAGIAGIALVLLGGGFVLARRRRSASRVAQEVASPPSMAGSESATREASIVTIPELQVPVAPDGRRVVPEQEHESLAQAPLGRRFCPECGNSVGESAKFCERCGNTLS